MVPPSMCAQRVYILLPDPGYVRVACSCTDDTLQVAVAAQFTAALWQQRPLPLQRPGSLALAAAPVDCSASAGFARSVSRPARIRGPSQSLRKATASPAAASHA